MVPHLAVGVSESSGRPRARCSSWYRASISNPSRSVWLLLALALIAAALPLSLLLAVPPLPLLLSLYC